MRELEALDARAGQHLMHGSLEDGPLLGKVEVVDDEEAAFADEVAKPRRFLVTWIPVSGLRQVRHRELQQLRVVHPEDVGTFVLRADRCEVLENAAEMAF